MRLPQLYLLLGCLEGAHKLYFSKSIEGKHNGMRLLTRAMRLHIGCISRVQPSLLVKPLYEGCLSVTTWERDAFRGSVLIAACLANNGSDGIIVS